MSRHSETLPPVGDSLLPIEKGYQEFEDWQKKERNKEKKERFIYIMDNIVRTFYTRYLNRYLDKRDVEVVNLGELGSMFKEFYQKRKREIDESLGTQSRRDAWAQWLYEMKSRGLLHERNHQNVALKRFEADGVSSSLRRNENVFHEDEDEYMKRTEGDEEKECDLRRKSNEEACGPSTRRAATLRRGMGRDGIEGTTAFGSDTGSP